MPPRKKAYGSKTAFILGMPSASATEIVAAASKAGLKFSEKYVATIRYNAKRGARPKSHVARRKSGPAATKTEFVLRMGDAPAKDVVAAAKKAGMRLTDRYVYTIRIAHKAKARGNGFRSAGGRGAEANLRLAIAELGLTRARQVLQEVEAAFGDPPRRSRARDSATGRTAVATFILSHPGMPIKEVVAAGARKGLRFSGSYVSRLQSESK